MGSKFPPLSASDLPPSNIRERIEMFRTERDANRFPGPVDQFRPPPKRIRQDFLHHRPGRNGQSRNQRWRYTASEGWNRNRA